MEDVFLFIDLFYLFIYLVIIIVVDFVVAAAVCISLKLSMKTFSLMIFTHERNKSTRSSLSSSGDHYIKRHARKLCDPL